MAKRDEDSERLFLEIYEQQFDYVWRLLRRFGARVRDQEDLAHDVFVAVHRSLARYDRDRPIRPWLFGVAFRVVSDYRKKASFEREIPVDEHLTASTPAVALDRLEAAERQALVAEGLARIPLDQRAVFVMHELEGESVPDIARALGINHNTCYSRLRLARDRFTKVVRALTARQQHDDASGTA
jgi:RNA polymerase sigma-70 factor, ECF subfamily